jgi:hypothetical protein
LSPSLRTGRSILIAKPLDAAGQAAFDGCPYKIAALLTPAICSTSIHRPRKDFIKPTSRRAAAHRSIGNNTVAQHAIRLHDQHSRVIARTGRPAIPPGRDGGVATLHANANANAGQTGYALAQDLIMSPTVVSITQYNYSPRRGMSDLSVRLKKRTSRWHETRAQHPRWKFNVESFRFDSGSCCRNSSKPRMFTKTLVHRCVSMRDRVNECVSGSFSN